MKWAGGGFTSMHAHHATHHAVEVQPSLLRLLLGLLLLDEHRLHRVGRLHLVQRRHVAGGLVHVLKMNCT